MLPVPAAALRKKQQGDRKHESVTYKTGMVGAGAGAAPAGPAGRTQVCGLVGNNEKNAINTHNSR